jgi:hypothetical protein
MAGDGSHARGLCLVQKKTLLGIKNMEAQKTRSCMVCGMENGLLGVGGCLLCRVCASAYSFDSEVWQKIGGVPTYIASMTGRLEAARAARELVKKQSS